MSFTGISNLDRSIDKTNAWLAEIAAEFGTEDRQFAYRITRAWLHALRDRLPVQVAANFAAQLPELLRGVARELRAPLDVIVVRKLGVPFQPEYGFGAIGEGGARIIDDRVVRQARLTAQGIASVEARERARLG